MKTLCTAILAGAALMAATAANAGSYNVTVSEGMSGGSGFDTVNGNPYTAPSNPAATFVYTGPINFVDNAAQNNGPAGDLNSTFGFSTANVSSYSGAGSLAGIANYATLAGFLASSGSASGYQYGSYYTFDLGVLAVGTQLTIVHDDGISLFQGATRVGTTSSGPTSQYTDFVTIGKAGDTILRYSRQNGTPSILTVAVPEPMSLTLLGASLVGLGLIRRRNGRATA